MYGRICYVCIEEYAMYVQKNVCIYGCVCVYIYICMNTIHIFCFSTHVVQASIRYVCMYVGRYACTLCVPIHLYTCGHIYSQAPRYIYTHVCVYTLVYKGVHRCVQTIEHKHICTHMMQHMHTCV
jgi:hypothetical protein